MPEEEKNNNFLTSSVQDENEPKDIFRKEFFGVIKMLFWAALIVLPVRYYIAQPFVVKGSSMEPNFYDSDYLIVDEISYHLRSPRRDEPIVLRYPKDPTEFFIKRIIGLPGETVEIKDGRVMVKNSEYPEGLILDQSYLDPPNRSTYPNVTEKLGDNEYFVLGDNRDFSSDSRIWGSVPRNMIIGRAFFRAWPWSDLGFVKDYSLSY